MKSKTPKLMKLKHITLCLALALILQRLYACTETICQACTSSLSGQQTQNCAASPPVDGVSYSGGVDINQCNTLPYGESGSGDACYNYPPFACTFTITIAWCDQLPESDSCTNNVQQRTANGNYCSGGSPD